MARQREVEEGGGNPHSYGGKVGGNMEPLGHHYSRWLFAVNDFCSRWSPQWKTVMMDAHLTVGTVCTIQRLLVWFFLC